MKRKLISLTIAGCIMLSFALLANSAPAFSEVNADTVVAKPDLNIAREYITTETWTTSVSREETKGTKTYDDILLVKAHIFKGTVVIEVSDNSPLAPYSLNSNLYSIGNGKVSLEYDRMAICYVKENSSSKRWRYIDELDIYSGIISSLSSSDKVDFDPVKTNYEIVAGHPLDKEIDEEFSVHGSHYINEEATFNSVNDLSAYKYDDIYTLGIDFAPDITDYTDNCKLSIFGHDLLYSEIIDDYTSNPGKYSGTTPLVTFDRYDINEDGTVNVLDLLDLKKFLLGTN